MFDQFWWLWLAGLAAALIMLRLAHIRVLYVSIPSLFFGMYVINSYLGLPVLYHNLDPIRAQLKDGGVITQMTLLASLTLITAIMGMAFANRVLGPLQSSGIRAGNSGVQPLNALTLVTIIALVGICLLVTFLYVRQLQGVALLSVLKGDLHHARILRSDAGNAFTGKAWRYTLFTHNLTPFMTYLMFAHALRRRTIATWALFAVLLGVSSTVLVLDTQKGPLVGLLLGLLCVWMLSRQKAFRPSMLVAAVAVTFSLAMLQISFLSSRHFTVGELLGLVASRVFCGQLHAGYYYVILFPDVSEFLMGRSFPNPAGLLPFGHVRLSVFVSQFMVEGPQVEDVVGSAPTAFWGEIYSNFDIYGIFLIAPLLGFVIYLVQRICDSMRPTPIKTAATVWLGLHIANLAVSGFSRYLFDIPMLAVIGVIVILSEFNRVGRRTVVSASRSRAPQLPATRTVPRMATIPNHRH